ncbi:MAG: GC-type dockerin domain-anchored protein [Phycisphaerales bacterium]
MSASTWFIRQAVKCAVALVITVVVPGAFGQIQWTGATGTSAWNNPGNWQGGVVPGVADTARIASGYVTVNQPTQVGGIQLVGGQFAGASVLTIVGSGTWSGGEILNGSTIAVAPGGTLTIQGADAKYLYGAITNAGTINWVEGQILLRGGTMTNAPSGTMICDATLGLREVRTTNGFSGSFFNQGTLRLMGSFGGRFLAGAGTALALTAASSGSIVVDSGSWRYTGSASVIQPMSGTFRVAPGAELITGGRFISPCSLEGGGSLALSGEFATNLAGDVALRLSGAATMPITISMTQPVTVGEFGNDFDTTFTTDVVWNGGQFYGTGRFLVPGGVTMTVAAAASLATTLEVDGTLLIRSGLGIGGNLVNRGSMTVDRDVVISRGTGADAQIRNQGVLNIQPPTFCRIRGNSLGDLLINTGQLNYISGTLELARGSTVAPLVIPSGARLELTGAFGFPEGTSISGGGSLYIAPEVYTVPAPVVRIAGSVMVPAIEVRLLGCVFSGPVTCTTIEYNQSEPLGQIQFDAPVTCTGTARLGGRVVFNAPFTPGAILLQTNANFTINQPQQWPAFVFAGTIGGPASLEFTSGLLTWIGTFTGPGDVIIGPSASALLDTISLSMSGRFINRGSFEWRRAQVSMNGATFQNEGQFTRVNSSSSTDFIGLSGTNSVINHGTMTLLGGIVSLDRPESAPASRPSFVNTSAVNIVAGSLFLRDGSTSVPFNLTGGVTVGANFEFLCPTASAPTGSVTFTGVVRNINFPLVANRVTIGGGTSAVLQTDQSVPEVFLGAGASLSGPGALAVSRSLTTQDGVTFESGSDLSLAQGSTLTLGNCTIRRRLVNGGSATVIAGTVTLDGADIVNNGTWSFAPGAAATTINVRSATAVGRFLNSGTINKSGLGATVFAGGTTQVPLDNTGIVAVTAGTLTIGSLVNYDAVSNRLTAGMLSVTSPGVLNLTGVDVRTIGPAAGVTLAAAGATPTFLTNLTTNEGKLVIGVSRTFNATPVGGTFTNAGELSLRAGGVFNAPAQFVQTSSGTLRSQIVGPGPNQVGRLAAAGVATLDGTMIAEFGSGYTGGCNQLFSFLTAESISGEFVDSVFPPNQARVMRLLVGATTAAVRVTNPADVTSLGGLPGVDGLLTADDVVAYLNGFFAGNMSLADIASLGGAMTADGLLTADDIVAFLAAFFSGCG